MAYHFENIKLEKGMYGRSSRSFSQALEELDPSCLLYTSPSPRD